EVGRWPGRTVYFPVGFPHWGERALYPRLFWGLYYHTVQRHPVEECDVVAALTDPEPAQIQRLGRPQELVRIPNGVDCETSRDGYDPAVLDRYGIDAPFFLNVGGDYENKCLADACLGVRRFNELSDARHRLVLIGPDTEGYSNSWVRGLGVV